MLGGIQVANHNIRQTPLTFGDQGILIEYVLHTVGVERHRSHQLADTLFDALGDDNFALAGQQFHGAHFAHIHTHRVRGATGFRFNRSQGCGRFCGGDIIGGTVTLGDQQFICVRGNFKYINAHVVNHLDNFFDLIGVGDIVWQMVVDFGVGQVTLFLAPGNQFFQARLLFNRVSHATTSLSK